MNDFFRVSKKNLYESIRCIINIEAFVKYILFFRMFMYNLGNEAYAAHAVNSFPQLFLPNDHYSN